MSLGRLLTMVTGASALVTGAALFACSSDPKPSTAVGGPAADSGVAGDAGAGADAAPDNSARCGELSGAYARVPKVAANVSCTQKEECMRITAGICNWLGDYAVNAVGADAGATIRAAYFDANCNAAIIDCGSGGGRTYPLGCRDGSCVLVDDDGGVVH